MTKATLALALLLPTVALAADKYTEADFTWSDPILMANKATVIAGVNKLARENPACATLDPKSVHFDGNHGNPDDLAFELDCTAGGKKSPQYFTQEDVADEIAKAARQGK
jgi:hypothetical protein